MNAVLAGYPHSSGEIVIRQVANSWLVILPYIHPMHNAMPTLDIDELLKRGMDLAHERMEGEDEVLKRIRMENEPQPKHKAPCFPAPPKISDLKDENTFAFKTFPEVLEFLAEKIK